METELKTLQEKIGGVLKQAADNLTKMWKKDGKIAQEIHIVIDEPKILQEKKEGSSMADKDDVTTGKKLEDQKKNIDQDNKGYVTQEDFTKLQTQYAQEKAAWEKDQAEEKEKNAKLRMAIRQENEIKNVAAVMPAIPGETTQWAGVLLHMEDNTLTGEDVKFVREQLVAANRVMERLLQQEIGNNSIVRSPRTGTPAGDFMVLVKVEQDNAEKAGKPISKDVAITNVAKRNSELYGKYVQESRKNNPDMSGEGN